MKKNALTLGYKCVVCKPPGSSQRLESCQDTARHARKPAFILSARRRFSAQRLVNQGRGVI
eukprot:5914064-Pyramimonas_sp.AAC.1